MTKVMRKEARHTQRRDRASGVPLEILEHIPPKPGWPESSFRFFHYILWKNPNKLFGQPNISFIYCYSLEKVVLGLVFLFPYIGFIVEKQVFPQPYYGVLELPQLLI